MSGSAEPNLTLPTSAVRNTMGKQKHQTSKNADRPASNAALREYCDKHYHQLLPIIAEKVHDEKVHDEKVQQDKLKEVKARLNFKVCLGRNSKIHEKSSIEEEDLSQPWTCEETNPFTPRIRYFELPKKSRMPSNVKTYDRSGDPEDHLKIFQEATKVERLMHGITNPELIKRLHDNISKSVDEIMRVTTTFLKGEVAASNQARKKTLLAWKQQESPREILALDKGKFKAPPPMTTPVEKRNNSKFCEFHREVGHTTDECMHLKRQIEEMIKDRKLSHVIKELKQGKDQPKTEKKGETSGKDKAMESLMVQPWQKVARQRITQSFSPDPKILFPPLGKEDGAEGPIIIEADIGGYFIHRMYVDGGSSSEIMYEHCFKRLRPEVKKQMVPATTPLIGFSGEVIWPMVQILLPVK
ncbi:hypothetical protein Tco_0940645 [Tanacetum coccineum]|uniref:Reverse transcriptase domain-containing protein n=1 Tax=Tanacetum coccineum TaxID=301880 RepID=A0ABQ5DP60_9ASTR